MKIIKKVVEVKEIINRLKEAGNEIGLVPTMGALHEGHLSLIRASLHQNDVTIVSVYVNPTQFNEQSDFEKYPRDYKRDIDVLKPVLKDHDILFMPSDKEMYPESDMRKFDFGRLQHTMEGKYRENHFNGVAQIVSKFLTVLTPDRAYFGEKDYQQLCIIKSLVIQEKLNTKIIPCPLIRDDDGLAKSSRNSLLSKEERQEALIISRVLFKAKEMVPQQSIEQVKDFVLNKIQTNSFVKLEYFEIAEEETLVSVKDWSSPKGVRGFIAAKVGAVRLIDNVKFL
jgi:pantoate--beta-alanine ligase